MVMQKRNSRDFLKEIGQAKRAIVVPLAKIEVLLDCLGENNLGESDFFEMPLNNGEIALVTSDKPKVLAMFLKLAKKEGIEVLPLVGVDLVFGKTEFITVGEGNRSREVFCNISWCSSTNRLELTFAVDFGFRSEFRTVTVEIVVEEDNKGHYHALVVGYILRHYLLANTKDFSFKLTKEDRFFERNCPPGIGLKNWVAEEVRVPGGIQARIAGLSEKASVSEAKRLKFETRKFFDFLFDVTGVAFLIAMDEFHASRRAQRHQSSLSYSLGDRLKAKALQATQVEDSKSA